MSIALKVVYYNIQYILAYIVPTEGSETDQEMKGPANFVARPCAFLFNGHQILI